MNNPIQDPEELLRDAVVEAALSWDGEWRSEIEADTAYGALTSLLQNLRDHRAKASAAVVPERCEPVRCEFVNEIGNRIVIEVIVGRVDELPFFSITGPHSKIESYVTRKELAALVETIQKATPQSHPDIRVEPTDGEIRKFVYDRGWSVSSESVMVKFVKATLAHFSPTVSPVEPKKLGEAQGRCETTLTERFANPACFCRTYEGNLGPCKTFEVGAKYGFCIYCDHTLTCHEALNNNITDNGLGQENATQPAGSVQQGPSNEEVAELARLHVDQLSELPGNLVGYVFNMFGLERFSRTLLSQHSNPISDDILLTLRDYALTRAGKDLYLTDARRLVANSNVRAPRPTEQEI